MRPNLTADTIVTATHPCGEHLMLSCQLSDAAAPVIVNWCNDLPDRWEGTQWQAAHVQHRTSGLCRLAREMLAEALECDPAEVTAEVASVLAEDADTSHESASEWYSGYGLHITTEHCGDVELQAVAWEWLEDSTDSEIAALILDEYPEMTEEEAESIADKARSIYEAAQRIAGLLDEAESAYAEGDAANVIRLLDEAAAMEMEHGDCPAAASMRQHLLNQDVLRQIVGQ